MKLMPLDALAVTVTASGVMQVAVPVLLIVAIEVFAVPQLRPSAWVSARVGWSLNVPTAENSQYHAKTRPLLRFEG